MTTEQANTYKRIHWAHKPDLEFSNELAERFTISWMTHNQYAVFDYDFDNYDRGYLENIKPILRTLDDLTEAERKKWFDLQITNDSGFIDTLESNDYLLSLGIDVYGLIEAGHAVRKEAAE